MVQIIPAILDTTPEDFKKHVEQLKHSVSFQEGWVHIDFEDNEFVQNKTVDITTVIKTPISLNKEAHLMVVHPLQWIDKLKEASFKRVIFHFESKDDILECISKIKQLEMEAGIALNIDTPVESLEPFKDKLDSVLVMSVVPGFQGQPFLPEALDKIKALKKLNWSGRIAVDGAVRDSNAKQIIEAGADQLIIGSYLLKGDIDENLENLWEVILDE
ncbi:MAG: ribulose-phosphate 3-epimerase [Candidatus Daviesbacteria bacterium]|nr:ribulose-phosphate 3-epimerase [Candidatus Daviesbacteria bacterium]